MTARRHVLTDDAIIAITQTAVTYWTGIVGPEWAARIAAAKMARLVTERAS